MSELLIEIRCGEIPARMQKRGAEDFKHLVTEQFAENALTFTTAEAHYTPRRLALVVTGLPLASEDRVEEKRGPRVDAPQKAIDGFLKSAGVSREECEERETPKGTFLFAKRVIKGVSTVELLPEIVRKAIFNIPWPKSMRWGSGARAWVRPVKSGICVFDGAPVSFALSFGETEEAPTIVFGDRTVGHRFLAPDSFSVKDFKDYESKLEKAFVILNPEKRQGKILEGIQALLKDKTFELREDSELLDEVTGLVEWPVPLLGTIDRDFMDLPPEVLITSMRVHQRYFAVQDKKGELAPHFICVANTEAKDRGATILDGNEKVLRARLADARFFYEEDLKLPLEEHVKSLDKIVFHHELGTMGEKAGRIVDRSKYIALNAGVLEPETVEAMAKICKGDLTTKMVYEFPELQGIMGNYYAQEEGISSDYTISIAEQYQPRDAEDDLPESHLGRVLALADRIDTLVGFFAIGLKPTGSKDPFALRRAALGVIRILEGDPYIRLPLGYLIADACAGYEKHLKKFPDHVVDHLMSFFLDRLKVHWRERGLRHDYIAAVFSVFSRSDSNQPLSLILKRVEALQELLVTEDGKNLLAGYRRAVNILRIEEKKDQRKYEELMDPKLLNTSVEQDFLKTLVASFASMEKLFKEEDFVSAMKEFSKIRPLVDRYFEEVTVNAEDPEVRVLRLRTLAAFRSILENFADFSKIEEKG